MTEHGNRFVVHDPAQFNETWARAFNSGVLENILSLYEDHSIFAVGDTVVTGLESIGTELKKFLAAPGSIEGVNNFHLVLGDIALLRADWLLRDDSGNVLMSGSSAELIRKQADGSWKYAVDHASGSSAPHKLLAHTASSTAGG